VRCTTITSLGAYVLGALDERERDDVDEHVAACARCREELEALMPVGSYLARASVDDLLAMDASPAPPLALRARLRAAVRAERRRVVRRRVAAVAALAAAALLAVVAWPAHDAGRSRSPVAAMRTWAAAEAGSGVRASVAATPRAWGTELRVRVSGAAPGERCRLVARARGGRSDVAATWRTTYSGSADVTGAAAIPAADLVALDVVTAAGRRLVRIPMTAGGAS